jgi:hypothetical protein
MTQFILDTNVYRNLVEGKDLKQIRTELETVQNLKKAKGFKTIFSNIVAIELIYHLLDTNQVKDICFRGLFYLINDAKQPNTNSFKRRIVPTIYDLVSYYLFNKKSKHFIFNDNIIKIAHLIAQNGNKNSITNYEKEIKQVIEFKEQELKNIILNIENYYLRILNQDEEVDWNIFDDNQQLKEEFEILIKNKAFHKLFGFSLVQMAVKETEKEIAEFKLSDLEGGFFKDFQISIDFFIENIWKKLIDVKKKEYLYRPNSDPKNRWNSFYDLQLIFATEFENSYGRKTILVSQENRIRKIFAKHNKQELAMDLVEYNILLNN